MCLTTGLKSPENVTRLLQVKTFRNVTAPNDRGAREARSPNYPRDKAHRPAARTAPGRRGQVPTAGGGPGGGPSTGLCPITADDSAFAFTPFPTVFPPWT